MHCIHGDSASCIIHCIQREVGFSACHTSSLVRTYEREVERQKAMVRKAEFTQQRLLFVVGGLRQLFADENFVNLLRAEGLASLPKYLAERVWPIGSGT